MKIAIVAPSPVPFTIGGAEKLWWGMLEYINHQTYHQAELIKIPSPERNFAELIGSYKQFSELDLSHFDRVISTKYPAWMVDHPDHYCYLQHKLRGLYDTYHLTGLSEEVDKRNYPAEFQTLFSLLNRTPARSCLAELFTLVEHLLSDSSFEPFLRLPSPLARAIVHYLDSVAMSPGAIVEYSAISETVAQRKDYFPVSADVRIAHHPSDLKGIRQGGQQYVFTVSRLDAPKRLDLLIKAYRRVETSLPLKIAGTGPDESKLRKLAKGDSRIEFLGRVTDSELVDLYAGAMFVPFMPYDEDFGLITIEAMSAAKPVLTTRDSGGVAEFVEPGKTGVMVDPTVDGVEEGLRKLLADSRATAEMGQAALRRVESIDWAKTMDPLLVDTSPSTPVAPVQPALCLEPRKKVVVVSTFPVWPPFGGGQARIFNLYKELAQFHDVTLVCLAEEYRKLRLAPGLIEICVPRSRGHLNHIDSLNERYKRTDLSDIADIDGVLMTVEYLEILKQVSSDADVVIASHPYLYKAIRAVWRGPLGYDSHNVEVDMKASVLKNQDAGGLIDLVRDVEQECFTRANWVVACSEGDLARYKEIFPQSRAAALHEVVPNGVDVKEGTPITPADREGLRKQLGLSTGLVPILFTGSWHAPNIEALEFVFEIAKEMPDQQFWVLGSVCNYPGLSVAPANVRLLGVLTQAEKKVVMQICEIALNPMMSGSGTNLKMLDYAAAGLYLISTEFGNRGINFAPGAEVAIVEENVPSFVTALRDSLRLGSGYRMRLASRARKRVEREFDWSICAKGLVEMLRVNR